MAKRRAARRRRRERRAHAGPTETPAAPRAADRATHGVSWTGLLGALLGFAPMIVIAVGVLVDPGEASRAIAVVPLLMAALYIPAGWASVAQTDQRRSILRGSAAASIIMAFAGPGLLVPPRHGAAGAGVRRREALGYAAASCAGAKGNSSTGSIRSHQGMTGRSNRTHTSPPANGTTRTTRPALPVK